MKVGLFLLAIVSLLTIWFIDYNKDINKRIDTERNVIPKGESKKIIEKQMKNKNVGDCILYKTSYGYKCIDKDGKCYKIYNNEKK